MRRQPPDSAQIVELTLKHYNQRARDFLEGTRDHDVSQNIGALLRHIQAEPPLRILDFGCGPGRDLRAFSRLGHSAVGLEGAAEFVAMARAESGGENAKFGLSTAELLAATEMMKAEGLGHCFKLLHFHIGSQVPDILTVKKAVQEAARFYAKLHKMGFVIEFMDVGGGIPDTEETSVGEEESTAT